MRKAVRAIIIHEDKLLVMHRNKFGKEYYTLVGGGIDFGETASQALYREIQEETGVVFTNARLVFVQEAGDPYGTQYIYLCEYVSGEPQLHPTSAEAEIHKLGQNLYTPMWLEITKLADVPFVAPVLQDAILRCVKQGFPEQPVSL
jgi:ADP-ribose pyrophosphatase YjhB (NUDIX family)